jgi:TATA-binding protein-associated factor Taf7
MEAQKLLEEQYIIRFQDPELGNRIRKMVQNEKLDGKISINFQKNSRTGQFLIKAHQGVEKYKATLCDLPCVVETHKTEDNRMYYKSGDIGQIIYVESEEPLLNNNNNNNNNNNTLFHSKKNNSHYYNNNNNTGINTTIASEVDLSPQILMELPSIPKPNSNVEIYDSNFQISDGLTPATKNIKKRKYRKRQKFSAEDMKEAQAEIIRMQKGGGDYDIELIPVEEVDEIYETPTGNTIVTMKNGKPPIRAGHPKTFTDQELDLLPDVHRQAAKEEEAQLDAKIESQIQKEFDVGDGAGEEEEQSSTTDMEPPSKKQRMETSVDEPITINTTKTATAVSHTPSQTTQQQATQNPLDNEAQAADIRALRCKKVDIANEILKLTHKNEASKMLANVEKNQAVKQRLGTQIEKVKETINKLRLEMVEVDSSLAKYNLL